MFDNRNQQQQPGLFGAAQQQSQQQVFPPQYQGAESYTQKSPNKVGASLNVQHQSFPVGQVSPSVGNQQVYEHKVITSTSVQPQIHSQQQQQQQQQQLEVQQHKSNYITNVQSGKKSFCIDWCIYYIPILFLIAILVFMSFIIFQKNREFDQTPIDGVLSSLAKNQLQTPIADLVTFAPTQSSSHMAKHFQHKAIDTCPNGYTFVQFGEWPGINSGCICNGVVREGSFCLGSGCTSISETDKRAFSIWNEQRVCMRTTQYWTRLNGAECDKNWKRCGNVCVHDTDMCPLSGLTRIPDPTTDTVDDPSDLRNLQVVKIGNHWYSKSYGGAPIVALSVIPGDGNQTQNQSPCLNDISSPSFESKLSYPLLKKPAKGCDSYGGFENEVIKIDTQKATKVELENGLNTRAISGYQNYADDTDSYSLIAIKRLQTSPIPECSELAPADVKQLIEDSNDVYNYRIWFSYIIFWICVISLALIGYLYLTRNRVFDCFDVSGLRQPKVILLLAFIVAILCILFGLLYSYNLGNNNGIVALDNKFNGYLENECFSDTGINKSIGQIHQYASSQYSTVTRWIYWAFWISVIFIILLIILIIIQKITHGDLLSNPWWQKTQITYEQFQ